MRLISINRIISEDHPNDPNDGATDQPTSHSLSEMDISMDAQSSEGTEPKADTAPELVFELGKEPSEDHEQPEAEAKLVEAVAEEPTFHEAKEAGQLTQIGGSTYETPVKKTAAPM
ncbi:unnamed protein product [Anisakis simplex]|uniref:GAGE domain-containing protein n=1 Tax=Anisakis simplex TaxID=6269 RepID=A0A0M3KJP0_ANISI|nr:unnamed protein product [Anisakis simplex]